MLLENLSPPSHKDMAFASGVAKQAAEDWNQYCRASTARFKVISGIVSRTFEADMKERRVLDWGSGLGGVALLMAEHLPVEIFAADVDRYALDWLRNVQESGINISLLEPGAPLPFEDNSFDAIYGISVLTHIPPGMQEFYLSELHRIVSPDGLVILTVKSYDSIEVAKRENKRAAHHPQSKEELDDAGIFYASYPEKILNKMEFASDNYGITYHSSDYIDQIFSKWFDIKRPEASKIGQQDVLVLVPKHRADAP